MDDSFDKVEFGMPHPAVLSKNPLPKNTEEQKAMAKVIHSAEVEKKAEAKSMQAEMHDSMKTRSNTPYPISATQFLQAAQGT
jgi:hypothetical protein